MSGLTTSGRVRRRADGERSRVAILDAAARVLGERPSASLEAIAQEAGVSRQTLYAHFPSREALMQTLRNQVTEQVVAALSQADLDQGPAGAALIRFLDIGWDSLGENPFLLHLAEPPASPEQERADHEPVLEPLEALIRRGQREGEFDDEAPVSWLLTAVIALGHAAGEEVRARRLTSAQAREAVRTAVLRVVIGERRREPALDGGDQAS